MVLERVTGFIHQIPYYGYQAANQTMAMGVRVRDYLSAQWPSQNRPSLLNRLHELYIQPLDSKDGLTLAACGCAALVIAMIGIAILGKPFIAFSVLGGCTLIALGGYVVHQNIKAKFNAEAAAIIVQMRNALNPHNAQQINVADRAELLENPQENLGLQLEELERLRGLLRVEENRKFKHLKEDLKILDDKMDEYKASRLDVNNAALSTSLRQAFFNYLDSLRKKWSN